MPWRLPHLLRPGRRLFVASTAAAIGVAWALDGTEALWWIAGADGFAFWLSALAVYVALFVVVTRAGRREQAEAGSGSLSDREAECLSGGAWRMVATAMAMQVHRGVAVIELVPAARPSNAPGARWRIVAHDVPDDPVERAVLGVAVDGEIRVEEAVEAVRAIAEATAEGLRSRGLAMRDNAFGTRRLAVLGVAWAVATLALMRLAYLSHPDGLAFETVPLLMSIGVLCLTTLSLGRATAMGHNSLAPLRAQAQELSEARARTLGQVPEAQRAARAAHLALSRRVVAVYAASAVVDDPRFAAAGHLWPPGVILDAWRGGGNVASVDDDNSGGG